jgi:hypothetical protein
VSTSLYALRFFRVIAPVSGLVGWSFVVIAAVGALTMTTDVTKAEAVMRPVLLLQVFAASSGFALPARRGHYDLLLTSGEDRLWIAVIHWLTSAIPGVMAWCALAATELTASMGTRATLLTSGTCAAMCIVSTLPWAITIRLPRFSGGIGWLLVLSVSTALWSPPLLLTEIHKPLDPFGLAWSAWSTLVYPATMVGDELTWIEACSAAPALALAVGSVVFGCRWIARASVPLEASQ